MKHVIVIPANWFQIGKKVTIRVSGTIGMVVLVAGLLAMPGCTAGRVISGTGVPVTVSAEGKLAIQARAIIAASEGVLSATEVAVNAKLLTQEQGLVVAKVTQQIGVAGGRLATVLRLYDTATGGAKEEAANEAKKILTDMSASVTGLPDAARAALANPMKTLLDLVGTLRSAIQ